MIKLKTPRGLPVDVPEHRWEDKSPRFAPDALPAIREYYAECGYAIVQGLFDAACCTEIRSLWEREVKPYPGFMYRQATAKSEKHVFNRNGWVMNPILNLQSVDPRAFPGCREFATKRILAADGLREVFEALLGDAPKIVQSMYFEGNSATWEHQDSYYLDSEKVGEMAAAWIAIEDIFRGAGRFFICPKTHTLEVAGRGIENNIADNHERYIPTVVGKNSIPKSRKFLQRLKPMDRSLH